MPYFSRDERLRIIVGDPATSIDGSVLEGYLYLNGTVPVMIHDRSGRSDVYPWRLLAGPVLRIYELRPRRKPSRIFADESWTPRQGE
jgi:hypothetical protein